LIGYNVSRLRTNFIFRKESKMGDEKSGARQSGGVNISGGTVTVGGDVVGRDKIVGTEISRVQLDQALRPVEEAVRAAPPEKQPEAMQKLEELKSEAAKGKNAKDGVVAKLVEGLVGLIPGAVSAMVGAFATPLLGGVAGPATKYVLDKIQGK
jgi:hypothetical protein